jgi:UMF1 family MFS transporter
MGGGILLAINIVMILFLPKTVVSLNNETVHVLGMQLSFLTVGIWWGLFSIPILRRVPEPVGVQIGLGGQNPLRIAHRRLSTTLRDIRKYRQLFLFIISFWFYNDGIGTIIKMATIYGGEIGIEVIHLVGALMLTQIIGIPLSLAFGRVADRIGAKRSILIGLGVYLIISIGGYFMTRAIHFWILACLIGLVQGGTQALSRSLFSSMVPRNKSAEFFSFYNISGKFAGIMGPAIFAIVGQLTGSSRLGILSLVFFFLIGGYLLINVDVEEGKRMATNWEQNG